VDALQLFNQALSGGMAVAFAAIGLFFFRFWAASRDLLFLLLGSAFSMLSLERVILIMSNFAFVPIGDETRHWVYLIRLLAFLLIIYGVIHKNREKRASI